MTDLDIGGLIKNELHKAYGRQASKGNVIEGRGALPDDELAEVGKRVRAALSQERDT